VVHGGSATTEVRSVVSQPNPTTGNNSLLMAEESLASSVLDLRPILENWRPVPAGADYPRAVPRRLADTTIGGAYKAALASRDVKVNPFLVLWRLLRVLSVLGYFWVGVVFHKLSGMKLEERQQLDAIRFKNMLERLGGVLIKVGQQLSQRPDFVPPAYCEQLTDFLRERSETIGQADVEAAIKRQTRKTVHETFAKFDWDTIGSASVSCVYKAVLHTGEEVAVKVRRPGIEKEFTADLTALEWLLRLAELLTIWRPGMSHNFRKELRNLLLEELDFKREARYQELFRRYHKRRKKLNVTAPKIYYRYSGEEVMVSEFVTGRSVQEIIDAMDRDDKEYLAAMKRDGIEPRKLAKQLVRSRYYSFHECPLFHGDPHPANIFVQPNNKVVMIDFGACGVFSERDRNLMWQLNQYYSKEDVGGMVNMVISIMEPIDPVRGVQQFKKELLDAWWTGFYGIKSNHAQWWERSSFRLWLKFFELIRKHEIPIPRNMVRMIRATLLYDTVAAKLYPQINVFKEFEKYSRDVAKRARRQIEKSAIRQLLLGPDDRNFLKAQQIVDVGNGILWRVQKFLDDPGFNFAEVAGKVYSAVRSFVRAAIICVATGLIGSLIAGFLQFAGLLESKVGFNLFKDGFLLLDRNEWHLLPKYGTGALQFIMLICLLISSAVLLAYGRRIYLRFGDVDD
jgi:ubiquinone biosynthesis protein